MKAETGEGYWSLVEPLWDQLNEAWDVGPEEFIRRFTSTRSGARHLYAAHWCISEVENGGLFQFFWNSTGILAPEAKEGFTVVGLGNLARILEEAMRHFGEPYLRERKDRLASLPNWPQHERTAWDPFHELDDRFYDFSVQWEAAANAFAQSIKQSTIG
jgi:Domain of unknown function (DUF4375)